MSAGGILIIYGAVLYGAVYLLLRVTTHEQRDRWFWNFLAAVAVVGGLGFLYEVLSSHGRFIGF